MKKNVNNIKINDCLIEIKNRILVFISSIIIFRIGSFIPIPGIKMKFILKNIFKNKEESIIKIFNLFSGGALKRASIFSLGIMPYISSSIIFQLLSISCSYFIELKKDSEYGRKKIDNYIYIGALILSILQATITIISLPKLLNISNIIINYNYKLFLLSILNLTTGTIFLIWLSEQITIRGIGNGVSILIFLGILSEFCNTLLNVFKMIKNNNLNIIYLIFISLIIFIIINFIVFIESGQRKIIVNYSRKYNSNKNFFSLPTTHLPIKINISGATPIIFASSIILLPINIIFWINKYLNYNILTLLINILNPESFIYILLYIGLVFLFCFIYTNVMFNSDETSENLKKSGAFISGIRPGNQTSIYINDIVNKLTFIGSCYISIIYLIPNIIKNIINFPLIINGTSILIIVVVIIDIITQINTIIISTQYESILKKMNIN